ncbi:response regulator [Natronolimnohabitans sp. A-GB9]|uniref:response regulator n=1 Tax=Natronolimnohabitans sp. A-GB9 TaxID=3069757 RepID=UPI0027B66FFF|nr:response regulator [Natronolimnohabitans sp. A-GB9]MDQ2051331.1 response regulator [Natronolimnohabitans sp. A-GB9]
MIDRSQSAESTDVLLIDPSPETARLIRAGVADRHPTTVFHTVADGADALDFLHRDGEYTDAPRPALVVLRLELPEPGPDGLDVLEAIDRTPGLPSVPVVVTVASPTEEVIQEAYQRGANAVVPIPDEPDALAETMDRVARFWIATARLPNRDDRL